MRFGVMMHEGKNVSQNNEAQGIAALRQQLVSSLKFHHHETLAQLPLEAAVSAITEAWHSSHPESEHQFYQDATEIIPG